MNLIGPAIYTRLGTDVAAVSALVGDRITPNKRGQGKGLPAITFRGSGARHIQSHSGLDGLVRVRLELDCLAATWIEVQDLAEKVRIGLDGQYGLSIGGTVFTFLMLDGSGTYDPPVDDSDGGVHRVNMDFAVWHAEATS